jgi:hypothetical protein
VVPGHDGSSGWEWGTGEPVEKLRRPYLYSRTEFLKSKGVLSGKFLAA